MHRATPWWLAIGVVVAVVSAACTSGSGTGKSTSLASAEPAGSTGTGLSGSAPGSIDVAADVFNCPSAAEINSLTAMGFTAAVGNGSQHCEYVVATGSTQAVRVTIDHPPAAATSTQETLAQFRAAIVAAGNVVLTTAPQYSTDSFIARYGTLSCSVFALARDGEVMQVQASHQTPVPTDDCAVAQSITAVAGTASRPATSASDSGPAPSSEVTVPSNVSPVQSTTVQSTTVQSTPVRPTTVPTLSIPPRTTPTTKRSSTPTPTEVLIFSTGPAASFTLPEIRPTKTSR